MPDCGAIGPGIESSVQTVEFFMKATVMHSFGHVHVTAVPRSTQPSTLCGNVK